jgi:signal transduction histidine kinase
MLNLWWSGNALRTELEKVLVKDQPLEQFQIETDLRGVGKRTLLLNARRLYRKQASRPLILIAMEDVTARRQAEEQLRRVAQELETRVVTRTDALKKSNEQMEAFCYSIAHDLRAPLRSMTGFSDILLTDYAPRLDLKGRDYIARINQSAERMDWLIRDLLNYGRLNTAGFEIQDVNVDETFHTILTHNDEEIKDKHAKVIKRGSLPRVRGHPVVLQAVLGNLLSNAMKFVAPGVEPIISVSSEDRGTFARIWVEDNGIGIAPQNRAKIFGVFERLHSNDRFPGTGIGLAIVHKGVERMGGRVGVESELDKGSRFWIELRKAEPPGESGRKTVPAT